MAPDNPNPTKSNNTKKVSDKMSEIDDHIQKRFDIRRRLGKGAYGIVWKAVDKKSKRVVAIKKIFDAFRNQIDSQRTFREIMFLQAFSDHPNIIKLFSIHRAGNNRDIYLGFEYMETDLHNVIKRQNLLKDIHMRYIMYQLFKAMKYIHSGNVIHRDLKPSNILLNSACHCKIADFGLARSVSITPDHPSSDPRLTDYVATRWYRAPEILIANTRYTKGIDMWSLGCIFGEMLVAKPLFPGSSTVNQVEKILSMLPCPTPDDIASITSGFGSNLLRNAPTIPKKMLPEVLKDAPTEAFDLISKLLLLNPNKRLTASECLAHTYVAKFHHSESETSLDIDIVPPLSDNIQLSVDDYRNKLYELMSERTITSIRPKSPTLDPLIPISRTPSPKVITTAITNPQSNLYTCHRTGSITSLSNPSNRSQLTNGNRNMHPNRLHQTTSNTQTKPVKQDSKSKIASKSCTSTNLMAKTYVKAYIHSDQRPAAPMFNAKPIKSRYFNNYCASATELMAQNKGVRKTIISTEAINYHPRVRNKVQSMNGMNHESIMGCFGDNSGSNQDSGKMPVKRSISHSSIPIRSSASVSQFHRHDRPKNFTNQHFNTYNQNHGIISSNALHDLKNSLMG